VTSYEEARKRLAMALTVYDGPQNFALVLREDLFLVLEATRDQPDGERIADTISTMSGRWEAWL
jgi:hypothetical protein